MEAYALHELYGRQAAKSEEKVKNPYTGAKFLGARGQAKREAWDRGYKSVKKEVDTKNK